jgi:UDP-N-acetylglucosamine 2-epimerase
MNSSLVYWLVPNKDKNYEIIQDGLDKAVHEDDPERWKLYKPYVHILGDLPREHFLGLLQNCKRFIGNSSAQKYEAPYFNVETVQIGNRNRNRESVHPVAGGSKRIAAILANIPIDDNLRRKTIKPCGGKG